MVLPHCFVRLPMLLFFACFYRQASSISFEIRFYVTLSIFCILSQAHKINYVCSLQKDNDANGIGCLHTCWMLDLSCHRPKYLNVDRRLTTIINWQRVRKWKVITVKLQLKDNKCSEQIACDHLDSKQHMMHVRNGCLFVITYWIHFDTISMAIWLSTYYYFLLNPPFLFIFPHFAEKKKWKVKQSIFRTSHSIGVLFWHFSVKMYKLFELS